MFMDSGVAALRGVKEFYGVPNSLKLKWIEQKVKISFTKIQKICKNLTPILNIFKISEN